MSDNGSLDGLDIEELLKRFREESNAGNREGANRILKRVVWAFDGQVRHWARKAGDDLEDVVQQIYFEAFKSLARGGFENRTSGEFGAWLRTIAWRTVADHYRSEGRSPDTTEYVEEPEDEASRGPTVNPELGRQHGQPIADPSGLDWDLAEGEDAERVRALAAECMPENPRHRRVIELAGSALLGFEDRSAGETVEIVNQEFPEERDPMTDDNVYKILSRYRKCLAKRWKADNPEESDG